MTQPAKAQDSRGDSREPSMEEILASIRRIIADDKPAAETAAARAAPPAAEPQPANSQADIDAMLADLDAGTAPASDDVLELTEEMAVPAPDSAPSAADPWVAVADDDVEFTEAAAESVADTAAGPAHAGRSDDDFDPLRARPEDFEPRGFGRRDPGSFERAETPASAAMLSQATVSAVESAFNSLATTVLSHNARTLEDLVKEMLRPMLKSWLDDNLPMLVERIVRAEIERVARGR